MNINFFENNHYRIIPLLILLIIILSLIIYNYLNNKINIINKEIELLNFEIETSTNMARLEKIHVLDQEYLDYKTKLDWLDGLMNNEEIKDRSAKVKVLKEVNLDLLGDMKILNIMNNSNKYIIKGTSYDNDQIILYNSILYNIPNMVSKIIKIEKIDNSFEYQINIEGN